MTSGRIEGLRFHRFWGDPSILAYCQYWSNIFFWVQTWSIYSIFLYKNWTRMRQFRFKCMTLNTNFIVGLWLDPILQTLHGFFSLHIDGNRTFFGKVKKKGIQATQLRMHNNAVHIECVVVGPSFWHSMFFGSNSSGVSWSKLGPFIPRFLFFLSKKKTRRGPFHVQWNTFFLFIGSWLEPTLFFWWLMVATLSVYINSVPEKGTFP